METSTEIPAGDIMMLIRAMDRDQLAALTMQGHKGGEFLAQFLFVRDPNFERQAELLAEATADLELAQSLHWIPMTIMALDSLRKGSSTLKPMVSAWEAASSYRQITGKLELQKSIHSLIGPSYEECRKGNGRIPTALV